MMRTALHLRSAPGLVSKPTPCIAFAVLFIAIGSGCQSSPTTETISKDYATTPGLTIVSESESGEPTAAATIYPTKPRTRRYLITAGDADGSMIRRETTEADRFGAQWMTVETILDNGGTPRSTAYWSATDNGAIVMHASIDHDENAISLFKPPLIMAYPKLSPGESHEQETQIRVVAEDDPGRGKERGTVVQTITCEGAYTLRTPIGEVTARRIVIDFHADMSMADATERTAMYVHAEHGIVAERRSRSVKILGMQGSERHETLVLAAPD